MGAIKEHKFEIDGHRYKCRTFPASEGLVILPQIIALLGEEVANLIFGTGEEALAELLKNPKVYTAILIKISERAKEDDGFLVLKDLMRYTTYLRKHVEENGKEIVHEENVQDIFDTHFAADYLHLLNVAAEVARASFGGP